MEHRAAPTRLSYVHRLRLSEWRSLHLRAVYICVNRGEMCAVLYKFRVEPPRTVESERPR